MAGRRAGIVLGVCLVAPSAAAAPSQAPAPGSAAAPKAAKGARADAPVKSDVDEARRLYSIGEKTIAAGRASEAVSLWRRAVLLLPATSQYDALRHKLVLRLGYGMLVASSETHERGFAVDAAVMLDRYAARHEQIFGDTPEAEAQRGEVYELLYEVETHLENTKDQAPAPEPPSAPAVSDEGAPELAPRSVAVPGKKKRELATIEDPIVRARLNSRATNVGTGLVMTAPQFEQTHPARALVRMQGTVRPLDAAADRVGALGLQALARKAFTAAQPALRDCFSSAFSRTPVDGVATTVELAIEPDGSVNAVKIVGPALVDEAGNKCVRRRLAEARVLGDLPQKRLSVRLGLLFFWEEETRIDEANGQTGRDMSFMFRRREPNHGSEHALPPIEGNDFVLNGSIYW